MSKIFSRYDLPPSPTFDTGFESSVQQHFRDDCDINVMISRFTRTGSMNSIDPSMFSYEDCSANDYQSSLDFIRSANEHFMRLPSSIRDRFGNNPYNLLAFLNDNSNRDEAISLGLLSVEGVGTVSPLDVTVPTDTKVKE